MLVKELISHLESLDSDLPICIGYSEGSCTDAGTWIDWEQTKNIVSIRLFDNTIVLTNDDYWLGEKIYPKVDNVQ